MHLVSVHAAFRVSTWPKYAMWIKHLEGNGCVERFIRTLKEKLLWGRHFKTIKEFWLALL
jgi:hypothetical protein